MKSILIAFAALTLTTGAALAAPGGGYGNRGHSANGISAYERAAISRSAFQLAQLKRRAYADGRVSFFERIQLRSAERRHAALISQARRS